MTVTTTLPPEPQTGKPRKEGRADRALEIYVAHFEEIALSFRRGVYRVPGSKAEPYAVRLVPEPRCSCPDGLGGECKHVMVARVVRKHTAPCAGCGRRFRRRELAEAPEGHEVFFEGDKLCPGCARKVGVR
ncbi:MAG: hypothetical protein M3R38_03780 [Actinomycetota bacterium]|nr:hypothetical protein [Actinomycetota bacterium]